MKTASDAMAHARMCICAWLFKLTLDEQAVFEFLSSVIVDLCSRWTSNVAQQLTLDEQFVDAAMPSHLNVKRSLAIYPKQ